MKRAHEQAERLYEKYDKAAKSSVRSKAVERRPFFRARSTGAAHDKKRSKPARGSSSDGSSGDSVRRHRSQPSGKRVLGRVRRAGPVVDLGSGAGAGAGAGACAGAGAGVGAGVVESGG